ncbi:MAG: helix-turn-helix transcriptional regulator [Alphaproteobacteria bacterium]|nr:helix-turn-helix transcriptional regulator [Alphaproteobacteria bacterium]
MKKIKSINGSVRGRLSDGAPNPVDVYVGSRLKLRRSLLGLSQERLADELGITFQQVQKYEKGLNRIGASRLWDLAQVLGVSVAYFYEELDENTKNKSPRKISGQLSLSDNAKEFDMSLLLNKDIRDLISAYIKISDPKIAKNVLALIVSMSPKTEEKEIDDSETIPEYIKEFQED